MKRTYLQAAMLIVLSIIAGIPAVNAAVKEQRDVKGFSRISFGIPGNLQVNIGQGFSVVLEGAKDDIDEVSTRLSGDKLVIRYKNLRFLSNDEVNVYITVPELSELDVSGSGKAAVIDPLRSESLSLLVSGSGRLITSEVNVENLDSKISGSGNITLGGGKVSDADIYISGSGSMNADAVTVESMDVNVSGSGNCSCNVSRTLDANISGSGNVVYRGNPGVNAKISGSGHVREKK
jgi:hypothetical protein